MQRRSNETAAQQAARLAQRVGVVAQHAKRDLNRMVRSQLLTRRPK
jgi:hypothetical protein